MNLRQTFLNIRRQLLRPSPVVSLIVAYLSVIVIGTILLKLPWATKSGHILLEDALFTATSALCVTGLTVVDTGSYFSVPGQLVILALIQVGGIGIMTFAVLVYLSTGWRISIWQRSYIQETYTPDILYDLKKLVFFIISFTFVTEIIGTGLLMISWRGDFTFGQNLYYSLFHSISGFCNAGFALFPDSFIRFYDRGLLIITVSGLIILGGLGFPVVFELWYRIRIRRRYTFSLHTKLVLLTTIILILLGMLFFGVIERNDSLADMSLKQQVLVSYFQSVTARTAGFATINFNFASNATLAIIIILMFIGASPGSCGGGIKTSSAATLFIVLWNRLRGKEVNNVFRRTLPRQTVDRTITIFIISTLFIVLILSLLLLSQVGDLSHEESRGLFLEYLFEVVSAFGTVGLSMGTTSKIDAVGKLLIIITMFVGRVGILTLFYLISDRKATPVYQYSEENVMIG